MAEPRINANGDIITDANTIGYDATNLNNNVVSAQTLMGMHNNYVDPYQSTTTATKVPSNLGTLSFIPKIQVPKISSATKSINQADIFGNNALKKDIFKATHNGQTPAEFAANNAPYTASYTADVLGKFGYSPDGSLQTGSSSGYPFGGSASHSGDPFYKNWGYNEWGTAAGAGLGLGQLGLGIASYLTNKKIADKQMRNLDQQYASNADLISHRKSHRKAIEKGFAANAANFTKRG